MRPHPENGIEAVLQWWEQGMEGQDGEAERRPSLFFSILHVGSGTRPKGDKSSFGYDLLITVSGKSLWWVLNQSIPLTQDS